MAEPEPPLPPEVPPPVPEVREVILDDDELTALFRDLRVCTSIEAIVLKRGPRASETPSEAPSLDDVEMLLLERGDRGVRGVQIRYRHDGALWIDTLMPVAEGVRLVRMRTDG